jgi:hypothetical protein
MATIATLVGHKMMTAEQYPDLAAGARGLYDTMVVITVTPTCVKLLNVDPPPRRLSKISSRRSHRRAERYCVGLRALEGLIAW